MEAADPIEVAFKLINEANAVPAFIVVFPYVIFSSAINASPSSKSSNIN